VIDRIFWYQPTEDVIFMPSPDERFHVLVTGTGVLVDVGTNVTVSEDARIRYQIGRIPGVKLVGRNTLGYRLVLAPGINASNAFLANVEAAVIRVLDGNDIPAEVWDLAVTMQPVGDPAARLWRVTSSLPLPREAVDALAAHFGLAGAPCAYMTPDALSVVVHVRPNDWVGIDLAAAARDTLLQLFATSAPAATIK
jgi:hypothetical protein